MIRRFPLTALALLIPTLASAQSIDKWTMRLYNQGAAAPRSTLTLPAANVQCGQPQIVGSSINPNKVVWNDPAGGALICIWTDSGTGPLFSVPFSGTYEGTLTATNIAGTSAESVRSPFTRPGQPPATLLGVQFKR